MLPVDECVLESQKMMVVILVHLFIQLRHVSLAYTCLSWDTHQIKHRHLHHTLVEVCCPVLDDLYCDNLLCLQILALDDLTESTLTKNIQDEVPVLVVRLLRAQNVIDVQDVVAVLVIVTIILDALARLREYSSWISRRLVLESGVADAVCRR